MTNQDKLDDFIACPPEGGVVHLPPGEWVAVRGGWRRLWGDGVHDDTEALQAYRDRLAESDGPAS